MLKKLWDLWWLKLTLVPKSISAVVVIGIVLVVFGLIYRSCGKPPKVITEAEQQEIKNAIADRDEKKLKEKLVEFEVEEQIIEGNVANAEVEKVNAIAESRKKWANANISELQAEFDRRMKE